MKKILLLIFIIILLTACAPAANEAVFTPAVTQYDMGPMVTKTPVPTPTPEPTPSPVPLRNDEVAEFSRLIEMSEYVFICEIAMDLGVKNIAEDLGLSALSNKTYMGEHQYAVEIISPLKFGEAELLEGAQMLLSIPYMYGVTSSKYDVMEQEEYVELRVGGIYLVFADYSRNFEFLCPISGEIAFFEKEDDLLYPHSNNMQLKNEWAEKIENSGAQERSLMAAAEISDAMEIMK